MLERIAEYFYDPLVFWTVPLAIAVFIPYWRRFYTWCRLRFHGASTEDESDNSTR